MAVSQTCDAGNHVLFTSDGGWIYNLVDGSTTPFQRNENIYELGMWLHVDDANGKPQEDSGTEDEMQYAAFLSWQEALKKRQDAIKTAVFPDQDNERNANGA